MFAVVCFAVLVLLAPKHAYAGQYAYFDTSTDELVFTNSPETHSNGDTEDGKIWYNVAPIADVYCPWYDVKDRIKRITCDDTCRANHIQFPNWAEYFFANMGQLTEVDNFDLIDTSHCAYFDCLFLNDSHLRSIQGLSTWDTGCASSINDMFSGDSSLTSLDLHDWDLSSCTSMVATFFGCSSLQNLNVSGWRTSGSQEMISTFCNCSSLQTLDVSSFNVSHVRSADSAFASCSNLKTLDLSTWSLSCSMDSLFSGDTSLESLDIRNFQGNPSNECIFYGLTSLKKITLGPQWSFYTNRFWSPWQYAILPTPPTGIQGSTYYTGLWAEDAPDSLVQVSPAALQDDYSPYTDGVHTWYWGERLNFVLRYDANGGTGAPDEDTSITNVDPTDISGLSWNVSAVTPTRAGYEFAGWNTKADGTGTSYDPNATMPLPSDSTSAVLYAQWREIDNGDPSGDGSGGGTDPADPDGGSEIDPVDDPDSPDAPDPESDPSEQDAGGDPGAHDQGTDPASGVQPNQAQSGSDSASPLFYASDPVTEGSGNASNDEQGSAVEGASATPQTADELDAGVPAILGAIVALAGAASVYARKCHYHKAQL